ncbi:MAG TPA: amidohydrolase family protein [Phycisphaeraceae bacterium]
MMHTTPFAAPVPIPTIDVAAWTGHYPFRGIPGSTLDDLIDKVRGLFLERVIVSPFEALFWENNLDGYEQAVEQLEAHRTLEPWPVINPAMPGQLHRLEAAYHRHRFRGIRLTPSYHGYRLFDPGVAWVMDFAQERGLIVQVFRRLVDDRYQWMLKVASLDVDEAVFLTSRWGDQKILLSGFDLFGPEGASAALMSRLAQCPGVFADLSWLRGPENVLALRLHECPADKLVYGSLWPLHVMESTHWQIARGDLPDRIKRQLLCLNAQRLLGLGTSQRASAPEAKEIESWNRITASAPAGGSSMKPGV